MLKDKAKHPKMAVTFCQLCSWKRRDPNSISQGPIAVIMDAWPLARKRIGRVRKLNEGQSLLTKWRQDAGCSMWNEVKSDFSGLGLRFDDMEEYFGDLM
jgi:hypothetical protein